MGEGLFTSDLFRFLEDLRKHNDRAWFAKNKERYIDVVQEPALEFVRGFAGYLRKISPEFVADDRPSGGSLFRIYRDIRFSKDKSPYKTHVGLDFRHRRGKDVHAPSFYLHLQPGETFAAAGVWHPDRETLDKIREAIVKKPDRWKRAAYGKPFRSRFKLSGDALKRAPAGFPADHPLIEDLKWKDHVGTAMLDERTVTSEDFLPMYAKLCQASAPYVEFLCGALDLPF
ncbi:MAG: TIGR02453 family protein [Actinobacteria bacterium]|nr:MAG: TIGR02453 family protein [Actinomycetota bacterium]